MRIFVVKLVILLKGVYAFMSKTEKSFLTRFFEKKSEDIKIPKISGDKMLEQIKARQEKEGKSDDN